MKLVMTLVVRNEADVIDAQLAYHLNAGVDFVIATDHRSEDGTREILESYERDGFVRVIRQEGREYRQSVWATHMARLAATEHDADWVISSDADEFWWPRASSLKEAFEAVPSEYAVVYAPTCYFVPRRTAGLPFFDVMTLRLLQLAPFNSPVTRYRPVMKAAHRASPAAVVHRGNHDVEHAGRPLHAWYPLEVLHFPDRSPEQHSVKYTQRVADWPSATAPSAFALSAQNAIRRHQMQARFEHLAVSDGDVTETGAAAAFVLDTRLRDVLRALRAPGGNGFRRPREAAASIRLPRPSALDTARHAQDVTVLREADLVRMHRRVDDLARKVNVLEHAAR